MWIIAFIEILLLSYSDRSMATFLFLLAIYIIGLLFSRRTNFDLQNKARKSFLLLFIIYTAAAYVSSLSYDLTRSFIVSDTTKYLGYFLHNTQIDSHWHNLYRCYFQFEDTNGLYEFLLYAISATTNKYFDGATVYNLTLLQTSFGISAGLALFKILQRYQRLNNSIWYTIIFSFCSSALFFSCVIIRDIIVVAAYTWGFYYYLKPYKLKNVFILICLTLLAWGIRIYSGLFMLSFVFAYIYINIQNNKWKYVITPIFILLCIIVGIFLLTNNYFEKTMAEIELYSDLSLQSSIEQRGLYNYFFKLPRGLREIGIFLFTQVSPFPITIPFIGAMTYSHYFLSTIFSISGLWFIISYSLIILLTYKKGWHYLERKDHIILLLALLFLLANTAELNVRRMLPVYPILFYYYIFLKRKMKWVNQQQLRINLIILYSTLNCLYILIKLYN